MRCLVLLSGAVLAAGCVPRPAPPPQPQPEPRPVPPPLPAPPPRQDWQNMPLTPGNWYYRQDSTGSQAAFGAANSEAQFLVRCDAARRQVVLSREGTPAAPTITIRTSYTARTLPAAIQREPLAYFTAAVAPRDAILDSMAFSRGRFTVEAPGLPMLILPTWPEPARVVEDCRR